MELLKNILYGVLAIIVVYVCLCMTITAMFYGWNWWNYYRACEFYDRLISLPARLLKKLIRAIRRRRERNAQKEKPHENCHPLPRGKNPAPPASPSGQQQPGPAGHMGGRKKMKTVTIYTDGACSGNPGPGGWGAILIYGTVEKEISGGAPSTTNNRMELTAVIEALSRLKEPCQVELWSDSKYVIDALEKGWAKSWRTKGWVKSDKKPALNPDLWERLLDLCEIHTVRTHWVKGHADNPYNSRCDEMAVAESKKFR